jgi:sugar phosphate isomerase/epimerase
MIKFGCLARYFNFYKNEISFAEKNNFDFVQLWHDHRGLVLHENDGPFLQTIKKYSFPVIIHALLDIDSSDSDINNLAEIIRELGHNEVIIHPICEKKKMPEPNKELNRFIKRAVKILEGTKIYVENNPETDSFFNKEDEIEYIFNDNPEIEFLLDIAHAGDYEKIKRLIAIKYPKILHIADKRLDVKHEHLPIGDGDINFKRIFDELLGDFNGKIIFEIVKEDSDIVKARKKIELMLKRDL